MFLIQLLKPGLHKSCKDRKHMVANTFSLHIVVMITGIHISQEIFAIDVLTALKSSLEQRLKHVLRLLRLYADQALFTRV